MPGLVAESTHVHRTRLAESHTSLTSSFFAANLNGLSALDSDGVLGMSLLGITGARGTMEESAVIAFLVVVIEDFVV